MNEKQTTTLKEELARKIFWLKKDKSIIDKQMEELKAQGKNIDEEISNLGKLLLEHMHNGDVREFEIDGIVSSMFNRENIGYTSENDVLNYLKKEYNGQYIRTKVTEALDKNALKKAIKTDEVLAKALESMTVKTVSEYVVVTDVENHKLMLEHINNGTNK